MPRLLAIALVFSVLFYQPSAAQDNEVFNLEELIKPFPFKKDGKYGLMLAGEILIEPQFEDVGEINGLMFVPVKKNGKWGYVNPFDKKTLPFKYDKAKAFRNNAAIVSIGDKMTLIDLEGRQLTQELYDRIGDIKFEVGGCNYFPVKKNDKWGYLDQSGKLVIPFQYSYAAGFYEGRARVKDMNDNFGYIDRNNKQAIPIKLHGGYNFLQGSVVVISGSKSFMMDKQGRTISAQYDDITEQDQPYVTYKLKGKDKPICGKLDRNGKEVVIAEYEEFGEMVNGIVPAKKNGKWGFINMKNEVVAKFIYTNAKGFKEGLARVQRDGKWGAIDETGKEEIPVIYDELNDRAQFMMAAKKNGKFGFIDYDNKTKIPFEYDGIYMIMGLDADGFDENGIVCVKQNGKFGFINTEGKVIVPIKYDYAEGFSDEYAVVAKNGKYGYIDITGKEVIELKYSGASYFVKGIAGVEKGKENFFIDWKGKKVPTPEKNPYDIFGALADAMEELD